MQKPLECAPCSLVKIGNSFTLQEGSPKFGLAIFGEGAGRHEAQEGLPFRPNGESGSLITYIVENLNCIDPETQQKRKMKRSDFIWDNVIKCQPPENELIGAPYEEDAIRCCSVYNSRSILRDDVRVILALGEAAFRFLTGIEGKKRGIEDIRGYVFRGFNRAIIGSLHPNFIRHGNSRFTASLIYDVKKALSLANGSYTNYELHGSWTPPRFVKDGKLQALVSFYYKVRDNPQLTVYYDIENPYTKGEEEEDKGDLESEENEANNNRKESGHEITSIQFACSKNWAITVPWEKPFIKIALAILALRNDKVGSNVWHHDNPRLEANGAKINGTIHDLMWAWHHMQPGLWKGLQRIASFFDFPYAWKHLAFDVSKEDEYGGSDVIAPAYIWEKLPLQMKQLGVWESYLKFKVRYRSVVLRPTEIRGFPVDATEHKELEEWCRKEVIREDGNLQRNVPSDLRNIKPRREIDSVDISGTGVKKFSFGYIHEPLIIRELREGYNLSRAKLESRGISAKNIVPFEKWAEGRSGLHYRQFFGDVQYNREIDEFDKLIGERNEINRWCKIEPFKSSSQQLIKYMKHMGYKIPLTLKTNRETTGKKELMEVYEKTGDEVLKSCIAIRSISKLLTNDIPNWQPRNGLVHTTFKFDPPSWQLNSSRPNIQNARKHEPDSVAKILRLGERFRKIVKAPKGRCIVEFDKRAFHVSIMGFEARDPLYLKWADHMHTVFTSYIVNEPIDLMGEIDPDKINYVKKKHKIIRDTQGKPAILGNQLGLGATKLYWLNKTYIDDGGKRQVGIESLKRAKWLQDLLAHLFPKVHKAKERFKEEAHFRSLIISEHGAIRWFHDVLRWDYKSRSMKNGSEAEEAIGHKVQAPAFGMMHSEILDMGENSNILEEHWFANTVHDSIIMIPEIGKRDRCIEQVYGYMLKPDPCLRDEVCCSKGLVVGVDVMASPEGGNWAGFHKERNPLGIQEVKI